MVPKLYLVYGLAVLGLMATLEYRCWSMPSANEVKNVPRSVPDNPGSYRSIYIFNHHYTGGK